MINEFNAENIELIGKTLNAKVKLTGNVSVWKSVRRKQPANWLWRSISI